MVWFVALGSAIGGASRFLLSGLIQQRTGAEFPLGTLAINVTGSLLFGFLLRYALATSVITPNARALLTTGFCGGYTTFSTFTYETVTLLLDGEYRRAALYMLLSVGVGLIAMLCGLALAGQLLTVRERA